MILTETYGVTGKSNLDRIRSIPTLLNNGGLRPPPELSVFGSSIFMQPDVRPVPVRTPRQSHNLREKGTHVGICKRALRDKPDSLIRDLLG